jgi:hypothetical protein
MTGRDGKLVPFRVLTGSQATRSREPAGAPYSSQAQQPTRARSPD